MEGVGKEQELASDLAINKHIKAEGSVSRKIKHLRWDRGSFGSRKGRKVSLTVSRRGY